MRPEFYGPLSNSSCGFSVLDDISKGSRTNHSDRVTLEIMLKLPACHEHTINKLLPMWIPLFGLNEYFADIINRPLNRMLLTLFLALHHHSHTDGPCVSSYIQQ